MQVKLGIIAVLAVVVVLAAWLGRSNVSNLSPQTIVGVPTQVRNSAAVPPALSTEPPQATPIPPSPTSQVVASPTIKIWPTPVAIQGVTFSTMTTSSEVGLEQKSTLDSSEAVSQFMWAPTGDKLVYLTLSGKLYWSNPDGSNAVLLLQYSDRDNQLAEQMPLSNTLLIPHLGDAQPDGSRTSSYMDVIEFTKGQLPTLQRGPDLPHLPVHLQWWSPTRASGFAHTGSDGGDLLVTVDQNGNLVDEVNVPYIISGAVRPGGEWLAYSTTYQVTDPVDGSTPETAYLLNLSTGRRIRVGAGWVGNWSPDGNWFLLSSPDVGLAVVSANGLQRLTIPDLTADVDAVWSPDSKYLAYAYVQGQSSNGDTISSWTGKIHLVNIPERKVSNVSPDFGTKAGANSTLMWQPRWSRDSSLVSFLSFDPDCPFECSQLTPAIINMSPTR